MQKCKNTGKILKKRNPNQPEPSTHIHAPLEWRHLMNRAWMAGIKRKITNKTHPLITIIQFWNLWNNKMSKIKHKKSQQAKWTEIHKFVNLNACLHIFDLFEPKRIMLIPILNFHLLLLFFSLSEFAFLYIFIRFTLFFHSTVWAYKVHFFF